MRTTLVLGLLLACALVSVPAAAAESLSETTVDGDLACTVYVPSRTIDLGGIAQLRTPAICL